MLNAQNTRELAYLVRVSDIKPIEGKDRVECAIVNGWTCMVPKNTFTPNSIGIYFEIDSLVPPVEPFKFLEKRKYKIKTQKFKNFYSQGLLMSPNDFGWTEIEDGVKDEKGNLHLIDDETRFLTKKLNITYYDPEDRSRKSNGIDKYKRMAARHHKLFKKPYIKWLMRRTWGKKLLFIFFGKPKNKKKGLPAWVKKTDEERIESMPWILEDKRQWIATEKIDGTSTTFTIRRHNFLKNKFNFYVCDRNVVFDNSNKPCYYDTNVYWEMAEKYNIEKALTDLMKSHREWNWCTLQGETYGAGIQVRDYGLTEHHFMGFNFITSKEGRWNSVRAAKLMHDYDIPWVPILDENYILPDSIEELRAFSHSEGSRIDGVIKEGIVFRSQDGSMSFKCVDPEFLVKYHN